MIGTDLRISGASAGVWMVSLSPHFVVQDPNGVNLSQVSGGVGTGLRMGPWDYRPPFGETFVRSYRDQSPIDFRLDCYHAYNHLKAVWDRQVWFALCQDLVPVILVYGPPSVRVVLPNVGNAPATSLFSSQRQSVLFEASFLVRIVFSPVPPRQGVHLSEPYLPQLSFADMPLLPPPTNVAIGDVNRVVRYLDGVSTRMMKDWIGSVRPPTWELESVGDNIVRIPC